MGASDWLLSVITQKRSTFCIIFSFKAQKRRKIIHCEEPAAFFLIE